MATKVRQYTLNGLFVAEYGSIKEASEKAEVSSHRISQCVRSDSLMYCDGFIWTACWRDDRPAGTPLFVKPSGVVPYADGRKGKARAVRQYTKDGKFVAEFRTSRDAGRQFHVTGAYERIAKCCKRKPKAVSYKGFI